MLPPTPLLSSLPLPSAAALAVSEALRQLIRTEIEAADGWLDFARFMDLALYAPGLGYYSAGSTKLGAAGDFVTAPELSGALASALALTLANELDSLGEGTVLEIGAGTGTLAEQLLEAFARLGRPVSYRILEVSADLRARQQARLARFEGAVTWLDRLPAEKFAGVAIANELLDAIPVTLFEKTAGRVLARGVGNGAQGFEWQPRERESVTADVDAIETRLGRCLRDGYRSELRPLMFPWIESLSRSLRRGSVVLIDYGLVEREYYHEQRSAGTLMCHYRHRAHDDPFKYPGLQDITAWVDFSACARAATSAGFVVDGFTTQGQYLAHSLAAAPPALTPPLSLREQSALKTLLLPGEMGERFKVLLLRKDCCGTALPGRDFRHRLQL